jgi:hypothetical protein
MFQCFFCLSVYPSENGLLQHEQNRGHWHESFNGKKRIGGQRLKEIIHDLLESESSGEEDTDSLEEEEEEEENALQEIPPPLPPQPESSYTPDPILVDEDDEAPPEGLISDITLSIYRRYQAIPKARRKEFDLPSTLSNLWDNFTSRNPDHTLRSDSVKCLKCNQELATRTIANFWQYTSNLNRHLSLHTGTSKLTSSLDLELPPVTPGSVRELEAHKLLALALSTGYVPALFVENKFLKRLFANYLNLRLPSRKRIAELYEINKRGMFFI